MERASAPGWRSPVPPDGVVAVSVIAALVATYAGVTGLVDLVFRPTPDGFGLSVVAYAQFGLLLGLWRRTLWGYLGSIAFYGLGVLYAVQAGELVWAAVALGVLVYLASVHDLYFAAADRAAGQERGRGRAKPAEID